MRLGAHNSIAGGLHNAVAEAQQIGGESMQIFCKNQRQWKAKPLEPEDIATFRDAVKQAGIAPVMVHGTYLVNMGNIEAQKAAVSRDGFGIELQRCEDLGIDYLNIHPGGHAHPDKSLRDDRKVRTDCLERIADNINQVMETVHGNVMVVLENAAGQGSNVGTSWEEVGHIADRIEDPSRLGVCVDTQHAWAAGHDWLGDYDAVWDDFDSQVGFKRLVAFHINDSKQPLGARVDRHDNIGEGHLGLGFFQTLLQDSRFKDLAGYLETPGGPTVWEHELRLLRDLASQKKKATTAPRQARL